MSMASSNCECVDAGQAVRDDQAAPGQAHQPAPRHGQDGFANLFRVQVLHFQNDRDDSGRHRQSGRVRAESAAAIGEVF